MEISQFKVTYAYVTLNSVFCSRQLREVDGHIVRREVQTGYFVHWAKTAKFLGRNKKVQTGRSHFIPMGGRKYGSFVLRVRQLLEGHVRKKLNLRWHMHMSLICHLKLTFFHLRWHMHVSPYVTLNWVFSLRLWYKMLHILKENLLKMLRCRPFGTSTSVGIIRT